MAYEFRYRSGFWSGLAIAIPAIPVSIMLRSAGKRRALSVLEKREMCRKREHAVPSLTESQAQWSVELKFISKSAKMVVQLGISYFYSKNRFQIQKINKYNYVGIYIRWALLAVLLGFHQDFCPGIVLFNTTNGHIYT